jgi:replicative DNA helicase
VSIDRLPPQSIEAEQSVLGALLIDRDAVIEVAELLQPGDFYRQHHGTIYGAVVDLYERREPVDIVTVSETLERQGRLDEVGGTAYLTSLINLTPTAVNAVHYARIVERKSVLRNLMGYQEDGDVGEVIDRAESELFAVSEKRVQSGFAPLKTLLHDAYDRLDYLHQHKGEISGIRTGFADLDTMTTGLQKSDLVLVAARPSIGKTSLALNFAEHAAVNEGKVVGVFSLEMSKEQLVLRLLSSVANIDSQRLRTGFLEEMDFARLAPAMNKLAEAPIFIDDTPNISTMELRTKARRLQAESGLDMIIVDYLQLMQASVQTREANRVQEVSDISRGLKALARAVPADRDAREGRASALRPAGVGRIGAGLRPGHVPLARQGAWR